METKFQSSFIPRGPMVQSSSSIQRGKPKNKSFFGFIAFLIFILAILGSVGVYGYEKFLTSRIGKMGEELEAARQSLEADAINEVMRLNSRIESTQVILDKHTIISPVFDFLEVNTVKNVRFTSFKYEAKGSGITLALQGEARGYSALALQAEALSKNKFVRNPVFTNLRLDEKGNVTFTFNATLDPSIVSLKNQTQVSTPTIQPVVSSTTPQISTSTPTVPKQTPQ